LKQQKLFLQNIRTAKMKKKITVIGTGFSGLAAACYAARDGYEVHILEKNESAGGRASKFEKDGFVFDMGPSWYWMPDVFETFFADFGKKPSDYYNLIKLSPGYRIFFGKNDLVNIPAELKDLYDLFENIEPGAKEKLAEFLEDAAYKYDRGINDLVHKPSISIMEFANPLLLKDLFNLELFSSVESSVRKRFKNEKLQRILEFPAYFLGATPNKIPALYTLMNHADLALGTWYPMGGMYEIIAAMVKLAEELGVKIHYNQAVKKINVQNGKAVSVFTDSKTFATDFVVAAADYHHVEQNLLDAEYRRYDENYWDKQVLAPSALIFYLGIDKKVEGLLHHNLFFDKDFAAFGRDIYESPQWPEDPLFYVCVPSKTDSTVAPEGKENMFILMPAAPGLHDNDNIKEKYYDLLMQRLESYTGQSIKEHVVFKKAFAQSDFISRYNSYKGNAYGLANTLFQTAFFKPKMNNPKIKNLVYAGQLTVPGPGVPPSLISGKIAAEQIQKIDSKKSVKA
jgi:phytoene desaturase